MLVLEFRVGADRYGLDTRQVREVVPQVPLRACPGVPGYVAGLFNYRGQMIPVVDLTRLFGGVASAPRLSTRIIVVLYRGRTDVPRTLGLLAESVTATLETPEQAFLQGEISPEGAPYLDRVAQDGGQTIQCVKAEALLPPELEPLLFSQAARG